MYKFLFKMISMAVWDHEGRMYMPVRDLAGEIYCYRRAEEAYEQYLLDITEWGLPR